MQIRFVSLISRDNRPLYIQAFLPENNESEVDAKNEQGNLKSNEMNELLKYNFLSHMSLDVFESPFAPVGTHSSQGKPTLLFVQDGILVYGSETLTGLKVVIGCSRYKGIEILDKKAEVTDSVNDAVKVASQKGLGNLEGFAETDMIEVGALESIMNSVRKEYIRYSCNPFLDPKKETEINSEKFDQNIKKIVEDFNSKNI